MTSRLVQYALHGSAASTAEPVTVPIFTGTRQSRQRYGLLS